VIAEFDKRFIHILVHSGQNYDYELNEIFFEDLDIRKPDHFLGAIGSSFAEKISSIILLADAIFEAEKPDALFIYGDTNTGLAAIAAKRRKIPIFHMEAGNRCFDQRVPEELNRKVIDHLSDVNLVLTEHARRYLLREGLPPELVIKTGSHMPEVLSHYLPKAHDSKILDKLELEPQGYFLVSLHREENVDNLDNMNTLVTMLAALVEKYSLPIIVSTHPRTKARISELDVSLPNVTFLPPFGFTDYIKLQLSSKCVISDSGTITEESSLLNIPAVTVRNSHERPEGMDAGVLVMSGLTTIRLLEAVELILSQHCSDILRLPIVEDYVDKPVSIQISRIALSYVDYVRSNVWRE